MKQFFLLCGIAALAFSCNKGDSNDNPEPTTPPETVATLPLTVQVTSGSYVSSEGLERVPVTISEGDAIGLYILRDGDTEATPVKLTLGNDGTWSASEELKHAEGNRYFAYYPWQEQPDGAVDAKATDDEAFFAEMIAKWEPATDQSTPEKFAAAALMTASGETQTSAEAATLTLQFTPRMALIGITFPQTVYKFTNTPAISDYMVPASNVVFSRFVPSADENGMYLCQVNPASDVEIKGSFGSEKEPWSLAAAGNKAGALTTHAVGNGDTEKEYTLQVGDFFLADGNLLPKDTEAAKVAAQPVVGIVYQIDPNRISEAEKQALGGDKVHGQVISCQMLVPTSEDSPLKWSIYGGNGDRDESSIGLKPIPDPEGDMAKNVGLANAAIDEYYYTTQIWKERADELEKNYPLFGEIQKFKTVAGGPVAGVHATEWYLPAIGQWFDVVRGLGGYDLAIDSPDLVNYGGGGFYWKNSGNIDILSNLNQAMEKVSAQNKYEYFATYTNFFWNSSVMSSTSTHCFGINAQPTAEDLDMRVNVLAGDKSVLYYTRLMLCF